jgi:hypothetical protein
VNTASDTTDIIQAKPRVERVCRLVKWKPWPFPDPSLIGHCYIAFSGGWCVHRVPVFKRADGSVEGGEARERWSRTILSALAAGGITGEVQP